MRETSESIPDPVSVVMMSDAVPETITLEMMRESLYAAVVCDALDGLGYTNQSPNVPLPPLTVETTLVGRCKTTLWGDMYHADPSPYELELLAVEGEEHARVASLLRARADPVTVRNAIWAWVARG